MQKQFGRFKCKALDLDLEYLAFDVYKYMLCGVDPLYVRYELND